MDYIILCLKFFQWIIRYLPNHIPLIFKIEKYLERFFWDKVIHRGLTRDPSQNEARAKICTELFISVPEAAQYMDQNGQHLGASRNFPEWFEGENATIMNLDDYRIGIIFIGIKEGKIPLYDQDFMPIHEKKLNYIKKHSIFEPNLRNNLFIRKIELKDYMYQSATNSLDLF